MPHLAPHSHTRYGGRFSGPLGASRHTGPFEDLPAVALDVENEYVVLVEDFNCRLNDVTSSAGTAFTANDFVNSGWVLTKRVAAGDLTNPLVRVNHSAAGAFATAEVSSVLVLTPGDDADEGINVHHLAPGHMHIDPAALTVQNFAPFMLGDINPGLFGDRDFFWAASTSFQWTGTWNAKWASGVSLTDVDLLDLTNGDLTWVNDGGFLFHISEAGTLTFNVRKAATTRVVGTITNFVTTEGSKRLEVGFRWHLDPETGVVPSPSPSGRLTAYYRTNPVARWSVLGTLSGAVFPTTNDRYHYHQEIANGPSDINLTSYTDWVVTGITRETRI